KCIRSIIEDKELIFTYRSKHEGGENSLTTPEYLLLAKTAILTKLIDYIDVEFLLGDSVVNNIVKHAKIVNTKVLMSNHDWNSTPRKEIIENRLQAMLDRGADIAKVVCMPRCEEDVETLIQAGQAISKKHDNVILISLGELGKQTMTQPELTGSCIQFIEK
ncbi:MAG: type I 3-dehydroquinate dehydratase, partial [Erysipelotrichia bacterium]|nr:type I 3-dehydroquinate dehydratase [Erysipelotrichia bacterium]